jgi:hypothetical protein
MYQALIVIHSYLRWFVLVSLLISLLKAFSGYLSNAVFTKADNAIRHWTATIAHIQLVVGVTLYFQSPLIKYFLKNLHGSKEDFGYLFFGAIHSTLMLAAIVIVTIGSALAKRKETNREKFRTILLWHSFTLIIILIAIPWPFSPFANRPYIR